MTFGDKLAKLRRDQNFTQEQLADILGVSRQSISKWESDLAYPETDKLIKICQLFNCSSDYLLLRASEANSFDFEKPQQETGERRRPKEWKSKKTLFGMPLWHVAKNARGVIAIGVNARGLIAVGVKSCGVFSVGVMSLGVISCGTLSLGLLFSVGLLSVAMFGVGTAAAGIFAVGTISLGMFSLGAVAIGEISVGAVAVGRFVAIGGNAQALIAIGGSKASGSLFFHVGKMTPEIKEYVKTLIDNNVPSYLNWACAIVKSMLS